MYHQDTCFIAILHDILLCCTFGWLQNHITVAIHVAVTMNMLYEQ